MNFRKNNWQIESLLTTNKGEISKKFKKILSILLPRKKFLQTRSYGSLTFFVRILKNNKSDFYKIMPS